jgi:uncharacterized protein YndB with AHSA1/START domain
MPAQARLAEKPSLTLKCRLAAPPQKIYAAWTDPKKILKWFGPERPLCHHLLDRGWRRASRSGVYREVVPEQKLVFTWAWRTTPEGESLVTVLIGPTGPDRC